MKNVHSKACLNKIFIMLDKILIIDKLVLRRFYTLHIDT